MDLDNQNQTRLDSSDMLLILAENFYLDVVCRLFPSDYENEAIRYAAATGHFDVVCRLLGDINVNNWAVVKAPENGHSEVVCILLEDSWVDPSVGNNNAV